MQAPISDQLVQKKAAPDEKPSRLCTCLLVHKIKETWQFHDVTSSVVESGTMDGTHAVIAIDLSHGGEAVLEHT